MELEYRMYGMCLYQLNGRQAGIQFAHAGMRYVYHNRNDEDLAKWVTQFETVILLDGGTSSTILEHAENIEKFGVKVMFFDEPDLGSVTTSFAFLVDDRIYDRKKYPVDFSKAYSEMFNLEKGLSVDFNEPIDEKQAYRLLPWFKEQVDAIGGLKNLEFRNYLGNQRLANN